MPPVGCRAVPWAETCASTSDCEGRAQLEWVRETRGGRGGGGIEQGPGFGGGDGRVIREVSWGRKSGLFPVCCSAFVALLFCSAQNWSGRFRSRVPSRQTWRRTPGSRSRTSSCPQSGRVSQPGGRVTQRMTNSCDCIKIDTVRLQPVFPPRALETLIKISLSPRRVVFQDSHLSRKF